MHGVTVLSPDQFWIFVGSAAAIGLLCAIKDIHHPGETPSLVWSVPLHTLVNILYSVPLPTSLADVTEPMILRSAYLLVLSLFTLGGVSVAAMAAWGFIKLER